MLLRPARRARPETRRWRGLLGPLAGQAAAVRWALARRAGRWRCTRRRGRSASTSARARAATSPATVTRAGMLFVLPWAAASPMSALARLLAQRGDLDLLLASPAARGRLRGAAAGARRWKASAPRRCCWPRSPTSGAARAAALAGALSRACSARRWSAPASARRWRWRSPFALGPRAGAGGLAARGGASRRLRGAGGAGAGVLARGARATCFRRAAARRAGAARPARARRAGRSRRRSRCWLAPSRGDVRAGRGGARRAVRARGDAGGRARPATGGRRRARPAVHRDLGDGAAAQGASAAVARPLAAVADGPASALHAADRLHPVAQRRA